MAQSGEETNRGAAAPGSLEAEISVLGAMLRDGAAVLRAMESLKPEDFYTPQHQEIFRAMADLTAEHRPIDLTTLTMEMGRRGTLEGVGGVVYLMRLMSSVPTTANVGAYIDIVREKSTLRRLVAVGQEISRNASAQLMPVQDILAGAEKAVFDLAMNRTEGETLKPARDVLINTYQQIEDLARLRGALSGVPTGFIADHHRRPAGHG